MHLAASLAVPQRAALPTCRVPHAAIAHGRAHILCLHGSRCAVTEWLPWLAHTHAAHARPPVPLFPPRGPGTHESPYPPPPRRLANDDRLTAGLAHVQRAVAEGVASVEGRLAVVATQAREDTAAVGAAVGALAAETQASHRLLADAVREGAETTCREARDAVAGAAAAAKDAMVTEMRPPLGAIAGELEEILRRLTALQSTREAATMDGIVAALERLAELIRTESATVQDRVGVVQGGVDATLAAAADGATTTHIVEGKVDDLLRRPVGVAAPLGAPAPAPVPAATSPAEVAEEEDEEEDDLGASSLSAGEVVTLPDGVAMLMGGAVPAAPPITLADGSSVRWYAAPLQAMGGANRPDGRAGAAALAYRGVSYSDRALRALPTASTVATLAPSSGASTAVSGDSRDSGALLPLSPPATAAGSAQRSPAYSSPESVATTATEEVDRRLALAASGAAASDAAPPPHRRLWGVSTGTGLEAAQTGRGGAGGVWIVPTPPTPDAGITGGASGVWELDPAELSAGEVVLAEDVSEGELVELLPLVGGQ
jgi:hypothetical protein